MYILHHQYTLISCNISRNAKNITPSGYISTISGSPIFNSYYLCAFNQPVYVSFQNILSYFPDRKLYAISISVHLQRGPCIVFPSLVQWEPTYGHSHPLFNTECTRSKFTYEIYSAEQKVFISNTEDMNKYCCCMQDDVMLHQKKYLNYFSR